MKRCKTQMPAALAVLALVICFAWYISLVARWHTSGTLGNDPPTYVQMALDLAAYGSPTHTFPLFNTFIQSGYSWDAFITPGYRIVPASGAIAPTYAFGLPLLLALGYRFVGESALYWTVPLLGALSLAATFLTGLELWREWPASARYTVSAFAVLLLAASPKQIQLALVPMSDVPAQLLAVLALYFALRVDRSHPVLLGLLSGLSLGLGYLVRHPVIIMALPVLLAVLVRAPRWPVRLAFLAAALIGLFALFVPDLLYRAQVLGSVFAIESPDSTRVVWPQAPLQFVNMLGALVSLNGFGPAALLAPLGLVPLFRRALKRPAEQGKNPMNRVLAEQPSVLLTHALATRFHLSRRFQSPAAIWPQDLNGYLPALILLTWLLGWVLFHAPLALTGVFDNNLRYLLPAYPAVALLSGAGFVWLAARALDALRASRAVYSAHTLLLAAAALATCAAFAVSVRALVSSDRFVARAYGWMSWETRRDFDSLSERLPANAVIGVSDQLAGPFLLYTGRDLFRPAAFRSPDEFPALVADLRRDARSVFVLGNWSCAPLADASEKLPSWLGQYTWRDTRLELRGLPYECPQRLYQLIQPFGS